MVHDALGPGVDFAIRIVEKFEHQTIANQVRRAQTNRLRELQKLIAADRDGAQSTGAANLANALNRLDAERREHTGPGGI